VIARRRVGGCCGRSQPSLRDANSSCGARARATNERGQTVEMASAISVTDDPALTLSSRT
jgi:hypothetical protein